MADGNDEGTTLALGAVGGVVALVLALVIGIAISRAFHDKAPAPAAATAGGTTVELVLIEGPLAGDLAGTVYFELGQADLVPAEGAKVDAAVVLLKAAPARKAVLSGFHDASGGAASNAELAKQRAITVREALIAAGIEPARVGLRKPDVTTGSGGADEARRVEIRIVD